MTTSKIKWSTTQAVQENELEKQLQTAGAIAEAGLVAQAAGAVKMPIHEAIVAGLREEQEKTAGLPGKSRRRLEKKAKREANGNATAWDEVNAIAMACHRMLAMPAALLPMLNEKKVLANVTNLRLLTRLINSIVVDSRLLSADYDKITELHKDRTGKIESDDDMMLAYSVFTDYVNFTELTNSCLVPSLAWASEIIGDAMNELQKEDPELVSRLNYASIHSEFLTAKSAIAGIVGEQDNEKQAEEVTQ